MTEEKFNELLNDQAFRDEMNNAATLEDAAKIMQQHGIQITPEELQEIMTKMQSGDIYLMCSDGLTDMVDNLALSDILSRSENPEQCALNLLQAALDGGGKDNITIIVCRIQETSLR